MQQHAGPCSGAGTVPPPAAVRLLGGHRAACRARQSAQVLQSCCSSAAISMATPVSTGTSRLAPSPSAQRSVLQHCGLRAALLQCAGSTAPSTQAVCTGGENGRGHLWERAAGCGCSNSNPGWQLSPGECCPTIPTDPYRPTMHRPKEKWGKKPQFLVWGGGYQTVARKTVPSPGKSDPRLKRLYKCILYVYISIYIPSPPPAAMGHIQ